MEQIYTVWRGDNGVFVLLTTEGKPVKAGSPAQIATHIDTAHTLAPAGPPPRWEVPKNIQTQAAPAVPRPDNAA